MTTDNLVSLQEAPGSYLGRVDFFRRPDGTINARLIDMPAHVIESENTIPARFGKAAKWLEQGVVDLLRQGTEFQDNNHDD